MFAGPTLDLLLSTWEPLNKTMAALAYSHNALKARAGRSTFQASATQRAHSM